MSTQTLVSNKNTVRNIFEAFAKGDVPYILDRIDDDCEFNVLGAPHVPYGGVYHGKGASRFFQSLNELFETTRFDVEELYEVENGNVVAFGWHGGTGRKTGKAFDLKWSMMFKFKDGKVVYYQNYFDTAGVIAVL